MEENKRSLKRGPKDDLKSVISTFVKEQLANLELERDLTPEAIKIYNREYNRIF